MPHIYILRCADRSLYVGQTDDVSTCEQTHNFGHGGRQTAAKRPVYLIYSEPADSAASADRRVRQLKRWPIKKLEALVAGGLGSVGRLVGKHDDQILRRRHE